MSAKEARRSYFLTAAELLAPAPRRWMLKPYLRVGAIGLVWGKMEQGKTFVMTDLSCSVATGTQWCDLRTMDGLVVLVAAEGDDDIRDRVRAWTRYHEVDAAMLENRLFVLDVPVSLVKPTYGGDIDALIEAIKRLPAAPVLIVIDPLNFCVRGANEDGGSDLTEVYAGLKRLQRETLLHFGGSKPTILLVHHTGKRGNQPRGSYVVETAADATFYIERDGAGRIIFSHQKARSTKRHGSLIFRLIEQPIGQDEDHDPLTSCIAVFESIGRSEPLAAPGKKTKPKAAERDAPLVRAAFAGHLSLTHSELKRATGLNSKPLGKVLAHLGDQVQKLPGHEGYTLVTGHSNN